MENNLIPAQRPITVFSKGQTLRYKATGITINSAGTDVATFTGLPAKYLVTGFRVFDSSVNLGSSSATVGVFTATGGGGTTIVTAAVLTALTAAAKVLGMTIAVTTNYQTAATLYVRNVIAHGSPATVSVQLEILDLS